MQDIRPYSSGATRAQRIHRRHSAGWPSRIRQCSFGSAKGEPGMGLGDFKVAHELAGLTAVAAIRRNTAMTSASTSSGRNNSDKAT